jgi:hypothetical protein
LILVGGDLGQPFKIYSPYRKKVLAVWRTGNAFPFQLVTWNGDDTQRWALLPSDKHKTTGMTFKVISSYNQKALDVNVEASNIKTAGIQLWTYHGEKNQQWRLRYVEQSKEQDFN